MNLPMLKCKIKYINFPFNLLIGYANEVGEAFRSLTPLWFVRSTYGVASCYVVADTYDKAQKMRKVIILQIF